MTRVLIIGKLSELFQVQIRGPKLMQCPSRTYVVCLLE